MATQSTRRTFVGGAVVAAAALGSVAWLRSGEETLGSRVVTADQAYTPVTPGTASVSPEIQRWAAAVGQPVRIANGATGTTGRIHQVLSGPKRKVPAGVREQAFLVYFELDGTNLPKADGLFDVTAPIDGLNRMFMTFSQVRGAKTMMVAVFG